jgi:hypothetical protein
MISNDDFAPISALDLNPIKTKLMHVESGEGWSPERANAVETEYRRFLYLMKAFPNVQTAPLVDVDTFWHYHILDTMKYARDCEQAFGYFLHHYPYLGLEGENDMELQQQAGERMRELYESTFGVPYARAAEVPAAYCLGPGVVKAADGQTAWCTGTGIVKAAAGQTAWCTGTTVVKAAAGQTAWCTGTTVVKAAAGQTAWCTGTGIVKAADGQTAWCTGTTVVKAADVQTAYCIGTGTGIQQAA